MKIGLFFGSFNPIHLGHTAIARSMIETGKIDQLWFVVSPQNPLKNREYLLPDEYRLKMVEMAIEDEPEFRASDIEFGMPKPSYTISTLDFLRKMYPDYRFIIVMGADNLIQLKKWKNYEIILKENSFLIFPREGSDLDKIEFKANYTLVHSPLIDISSTTIRKLISEKKDFRKYLHPNVFKYIVQMKFYQTIS
jgi:nicotinate-nucleotide adenylyltransferase